MPSEHRVLDGKVGPWEFVLYQFRCPESRDTIAATASDLRRMKYCPFCGERLRDAAE